ncbi:MAG: late competence development ComFB family protein [Bacillota bacterium]
MISENLLKKEVVKEIDNLLAKKEEVCDCEQCRKDMIALALSNLKPRYAGTEAGKVIIESTDISSEQTKMNVLKVVFDAVKKVDQNPHHD